MDAMPPPAPQADLVAARRSLRPGDVTSGWRWTLATGWLAISVALTVTAGAGEMINRSVWWLGDPGDRTPFVVALLPFVLPIAVISLALTGRRFVAEASVLATVALAVVAFGDRENSPSAALVTAALAVAALLLSIASFSGRVRAAR